MDTAKQIEYYRAKYKLSPQSRVFAPLADLYRRDGRLVEAVQLLKAGVKSHPSYVSARVILGRCYLDGEDREAAREVFGQVLEIDPDNLVVLKLLAEEAGRRQKWSEAISLLSRVIELDPGNSQAEAKLDEWRKQSGEPAVAPVSKAEVIEVDSIGDDVLEEVAAPIMERQQVLATRTLADVYLAQGYRDKALNVLEQILEREPEREDVRSRIADLKHEETPEPTVGRGSPLHPAVAPISSSEGDEDLRHFESWLSKLHNKKKERAE